MKIKIYELRFLSLTAFLLSNSCECFSTVSRRLEGCSIGRHRGTIYAKSGSVVDIEERDEQETLVVSNGNIKQQTSKREMLSFAIPALGIYLCNPLLSNIDNAFVGKTVGTAGLAALSPATICTDQMFYMFSFLGRATTGLVSRAYATNNGNTDDSATGGNTEAARQAAATPLTVSLICGVAITIFYAFFTQRMLGALNVSQALRQDASAYIYWRGIAAAAVLAQNVCLSIMMATRDAITPLKIVVLAASVNVVSDAMLCAWPLRWGCAGAAAATSFATFFSCCFMLKSLANKKLLPTIRTPTKAELLGLLDYTGTLFAITLTRLAGFIVMQKAAMKLGYQSLAGYQLCINLLLFFLLFGEPLSQLSQTQLPALLDQKDGATVFETLKSILVLAGFTSLGIATLCYAAAMFGSGLFSADVAVQQVAKNCAPSLFVAVAVAIVAVAVDGAMLASRDFKFMLASGCFTFVVQLLALPYCTSVANILGTFSFRLSAYAILVLLRIGLGYGDVGRSIRQHRMNILKKTTANSQNKGALRTAES